MDNIIIMHTNGNTEILQAKKNVFLQAKEILKDAYIEVARTMIPRLVMLIDEEGKLKRLPPNQKATAIYPNKMDFICGDAILVRADGEELRGMEKEYSKALLNFLIGSKEEILRE